MGGLVECVPGFPEGILGLVQFIVAEVFFRFGRVKDLLLLLEVLVSGVSGILGSPCVPDCEFLGIFTIGKLLLGMLQLAGQAAGARGLCDFRDGRGRGDGRDWHPDWGGGRGGRRGSCVDLGLCGGCGWRCW